MDEVMEGLEKSDLDLADLREMLKENQQLVDEAIAPREQQEPAKFTSDQEDKEQKGFNQEQVDALLTWFVEVFVGVMLGGSVLGCACILCILKCCGKTQK